MFLEEISGPDVVVIDDTDREVKSLLETLTQRGISNEYLKVDLAGDMPDHNLISSIKLIFLDLNYNIGVGSSFDPNFCAELIHRIVPKGRQYYLVAWTKDTDKTDSVVEILKEMDLMPIAYLSKLKEQYRIADNAYDINKLLDELNAEFDKIIEVHDFYGEIIEVEQDFILINCLLDKEKKIFQIRRFDKTPFDNYINNEVGNYISIRSVTKPGSRLFEFNNETSDLSNYFKKPNYFEGLEDSKFFKEK
ncbi:MAG: hypothetical protein ABIN94_06940 [Ferruginibacter sp.]